MRHLLEEMVEDEHLARLIAEVEAEEHFERQNAWQTYQTYLTEATQ